MGGVGGGVSVYAVFTAYYNMYIWHIQMFYNLHWGTKMNVGVTDKAAPGMAQLRQAVCR